MVGRKAMTIVSTATAMALAGGSAHAISLEEAVRLALETNPRIQTVIADRKAADQELRQARAGYFPTLDLNLGYGREYTNDFRTRIRPGKGDTLALPKKEASLLMTQKLFDGFDTDSRVGRQKALVISAGKRVYENAEFLGFDAVTAYLVVVRQREALGLSDDLVAIHVRTLEQISQRVRAGAGNAADVFQTEVRLARSRALRVQVVQDLRDGEANFERVIGQSADTLARPLFPANGFPADKDGALELATSNNPTVRVRESEIDAAEAEIAVATSSFFPKINFEAQAAYNEDNGGINDEEQTGQLMVRLRWNLYRGGADRANRREAMSRLASARSRRGEAVIEAQEQIRRAWNAYEAATDRVDRLSRAVRFSVRTRDAYRQQFQVAQRTLLDLLDAENELFTSRIQLIGAETSKLRSGFRVLAVSGTMLRTLEIEAPEESAPKAKTFLEDTFN